MPRQIPGRSRKVRTKEHDIVALILAILIAVFLLTFGGLLLQIAFFVIVVYVIYRLLQRYL